MSRTLLIFALASGLGAQHLDSVGSCRERYLMPSMRSGLPMPGWWQRHLGDTALHLGASSADAATSWGRYELNPLLRSADGRFGGRGLGIKLALFGGVELAKWSLLKRGHRGRWVRSLSLAPAAAFGAAAVRNGTNR